MAYKNMKQQKKHVKQLHAQDKSKKKRMLKAEKHEDFLENMRKTLFGPRILTILLTVGITLTMSCTPFKWSAKPVPMNYAITIYDARMANLGYVLCESYVFRNDTLWTHNTGYHARGKKQRSVATMVWPPYWNYIVTEIK